MADVPKESKVFVLGLLNTKILPFFFFLNMQFFEETQGDLFYVSQFYCLGGTKLLRKKCNRTDRYCTY